VNPLLCFGFYSNYLCGLCGENIRVNPLLCFGFYSNYLCGLCGENIRVNPLLCFGFYSNYLCGLCGENIRVNPWLRFRVYAHLFSVLPHPLELHGAGDERKQRIVLSFSHVISRVNTRAPLPDDDGACIDELTGKSLHTEIFGIAVPSIP
jgi:hypothetical protein